MDWDDDGVDDFVMPTDPDEEAAERRAIQLAADLSMLMQVQPAWNVFTAWMHHRANDIARTALRGKDPEHSRDYWQGRLEECEGILTDLQRVIADGERVRAVHQELAAKVHGDTG